MAVIAQKSDYEAAHGSGAGSYGVKSIDLSTLWLTAEIEAGSAMVELTNGIDSDVLLGLAESPAATERILSALAFNRSVAIRQAVADHSRTPFLTLLILVDDESADVRYRLAENHNVPERVLQMLAQDENPYVSCRAQSTLDRRRAAAA